MDFLIYQSEDGSTRIDVMLEAETLWLNQKQLTDLFGKAKGTISEHIKHIFEDGEQDEKFSCSVFPNNCHRWQAVRGGALQPGHDAVPTPETNRLTRRPSQRPSFLMI